MATPGSEVDRLYVTLKFRESLGEQVDDVGDHVEDLEDRFQRGMGTAQSETEQTGDELDQLKRKVSSLRAQLRRLDGAEASVDVVTDRDVDRDRGRLPGELDEVQEAVTFFGSLSAKTKALIGATGAAAAALGSAGGLAAVATNLAAQFGDQGIQKDLNALQRRLKGTANVFAAEFEPVIRNQVIPAADALAKAARESADELASFTGAVLGFLGAGQGDSSGSPTVGGGLGIGDIRGDRAQPEITAGTGGPAGLENAQRKLDALRTKLLRVGRAQDLLTDFTRSQRKALQQQVQATKQAIQKAAKFGAKLDKQSLGFQQVRKFIRAATADLERYKEQLQTLNQQQFLERIDRIQTRIDQATRRPAREAEGRGPETNTAIPVPKVEDLKRMNRELKKAGQLSARLQVRLQAGLKRAGVRALTSGFEALGKAIVGAGEAAKSIKGIIQNLVRTVGQLLLRLGIASGNPALIVGGAIGTIAGGAIGGSKAKAASVRTSKATAPKVGTVQSAGAARLAGGTIELPVEVVASAADQGRRRQRRSGRR